MIEGVKYLFSKTKALIKPNIPRLVARRDFERLLRALRHENVSVRQEAFRALVDTGALCVEHLLKTLEVHTELRHEITRILCEIADRRAVQAIIEGLKDTSIRPAAIQALIKIGEPAILPLVELLQSRDWEIRRAAADALIGIHAQCPSPIILKAKEHILLALGHEDVHTDDAPHTDEMFYYSYTDWNVHDDTTTHTEQHQDKIHPVEFPL